VALAAAGLAWGSVGPASHGAIVIVVSDVAWNWLTISGTYVAA
jgi:hypothetical protein